ncbi:MAG: hypothetical protein PHO90_01695 [Candidatus Pacebacteria bacterium]|nr:hypothetical protein [Candidatus Paceibacterota bacterium]
MQYKKPQPVFILSFFLIIGAIALGYYLFLPNYKKFNEQRSEMVRINSAIQMKNNYESKINEIGQKLKDIDWEGKREKIEINFDSGPFFLPKTEIFFRDAVSKSGMSFASISFSSPTLAKGTSQQQSQGSDDSTKETKKEFKPESSVQTQSSGAFSGLKGPVAKVPFNLSVSGSYQAFKALLKGFEKQAFLISIKTITFTAPGTDGNVSFAIAGEVYSY